MVFSEGAVTNGLTHVRKAAGSNPLWGHQWWGELSCTNCHSL